MFKCNRCLLSDIWMLGDSLLFWAGERAISLGQPNLTLDRLQVNIIWKGQSSMTWELLRQKLQWVSLHRNPFMIVIHLGGNNVLSTSIQKMERIIKRDLKHISLTFPSTIFVWSDILPRLKWKYSGPDADLKAIDHKRHRFNLKAHAIIQTFKMGRIIMHDISSDSPNLFIHDGCHLSNVGLDIFNHTLQGDIETFLTSDVEIFGR